MENINEQLAKLTRDVEFIKEVLRMKKDPEGELSDWAKEGLEKARKSKYKVSHEEVKRRILGK